MLESRWSPLTQELARKLGLKLGDAVTVNVLGRNITARISNLRELQLGKPRDKLCNGLLAEHSARRAA